MTRPVLFLDISRLVRRFASLGGPTGIDRIELRYADWFSRQDAFEARPVALSGRRLVVLRWGAFETVVSTLVARWTSARPPQVRPGSKAAGAAHEARTAARLVRILVGARPLDATGRANATLNVGHEGLHLAERYDGLPGPFAVLLHDLIPITHPEYDTAKSSALHYRRLGTLIAKADHVFTVSEAVRSDLVALAPHARFTTSVLHSGPGLERSDSPIVPDRPTFIHLSSIDRRKNLPLLLHIWREFAGAPDPPALVVIGRRGNDQTALELLDRCTALAPNVVVAGSLGDNEVAARLTGARALLTPSFAEGFGLPIVEAHAMGVPVIASDIPAHREVGGAEATFLSPLDGVGWAEMIRAYAADGGLAEQQRRAIVPPRGWDDYFEEATEALLRVAHRRRR